MKKLAKLFLTGIITGSMILSSNSIFANTQEKIIKVRIGSNIANVNGNNITIDAIPYIQKETNSTMIPLRFVATALEIPESNIKFDTVTKIITIIKGDDVVEFKVNSNKYRKNGIFSFDVTIYGLGMVDPIVEIKNGRTFVPFRTLAEAFNLDVEWESNTKTAIMKTAGATNNNQNNSQNNSSSNNNVNNQALTEKEIRALEEEVVKLVNEERAKYGLQPVQISEKLMETAKMKSEDMATRNYFSHTDPDGYTLYQQIEGFKNFWTIMENCHAGSTNPEGAVSSWMESKEGHREQILTPEYKYVGVGYAKNPNSKYSNYWVLHFSKDDKWSDSSSYTINNGTTNNKPTNNTQNNSSSNNNNNVNNQVLTEQEIRALEEEIIMLANEERAKHGLKPLKIDESLMKTAREKSKDMATRNYFSHTDPDGYTMATDLRVGENIAAGTTGASETIELWMNSEVHRENILNPNYTYIGVGYAKNSSSEYTDYWTQQFK